MQNVTESQRKVQSLLAHSTKTSKVFHMNNFYEGKNINVLKLKQQITLAKKQLLQDRDFEHREQASQPRINDSFDTYTNVNTHVNVGIERARRGNLSRGIVYKSRNINAEAMRRQATQMTDYQRLSKNVTRKQTAFIHRANTNPKDQIIRQQPRRLKTIHDDSCPVQQHRFSSIDAPSARNSLSVTSVQLEHDKIILREHSDLKLFEARISSLWELYECIAELMQGTAREGAIQEKQVLDYLHLAASSKYEFVNELCDLFMGARIQRSIRLSRVLQLFSVFEACLNSIQSSKLGTSEIINYLGFSSSSVIFLIKLLLLTHQTSFTFSENVSTIISSISQFELKSYKSQLRNIKEVLRRLEHNNEIIGMIKSRCGKKHGKYCEEFVSKTIKQMERNNLPFRDTANNIFQFLSFYLHNENIAYALPLLSTPPSPFLNLKHPKTVIIEPWGVLAFRKNNKLVIRAHAGKFLAEIIDKCNLVFWTELMPKDAQVLINLFPVRSNIHWLYRYHCRQTANSLIKIVDMTGCNTKDTIIIDYLPENYAFNSEIGVCMAWSGEKRDTKLLKLSALLQDIFTESEKNKTSLASELSHCRLRVEQVSPAPRSRLSRIKRSKTSL